MQNKTEYQFCYKNALFTHHFKKGMTFKELLAELPSVLRIDNVGDIIVQYLNDAKVLLTINDNETFRYVLKKVQGRLPKRFYINHSGSKCDIV